MKTEDVSPKLNDNIVSTHVDNVMDYFEIERCREWCDAHAFTSVALQFPDSLLHYSPQVYKHLLSRDRCLHVLADTSYGACCVDEVAAQRLNTAAIIHFGHACHSPVLSLPTLFVLGREPLPLGDFIRNMKESFSVNDHILLMLNSVYYHHLEDVRASLTSFRNIRYVQYALEQNTGEDRDGWEGVGTQHDMEEEYSVVYVGGQSLCLTHVVLSNGSRKVYSYEPESQIFQLASRTVNKMLIKRFSFIETIKNSKIIGILVGTLGIQSFTEVIDRMKRVIKSAGKKHYIVSIGKPNPAKLANFAEIEVFVFVGCCENTLLDSRDYYQPVVTPYELEIACIDRPWQVDYITDSTSLLRTHYQDIPPTPRDMTGELVEKQGLGGLEVAANFLSHRTWSGLEQRLGLDEPSMLKQGRRGIAGHYEGEEVIDSRMKNIS